MLYKRRFCDDVRCHIARSHQLTTHTRFHDSVRTHVVLDLYPKMIDTKVSQCTHNTTARLTHKSDLDSHHDLSERYDRERARRVGWGRLGVGEGWGHSHRQNIESSGGLGGTRAPSWTTGTKESRHVSCQITPLFLRYRASLFLRSLPYYVLCAVSWCIYGRYDTT